MWFICNTLHSIYGKNNEKKKKNWLYCQTRVQHEPYKTKKPKAFKEFAFHFLKIDTEISLVIWLRQRHTGIFLEVGFGFLGVRRGVTSFDHGFLLCRWFLFLIHRQKGWNDFLWKKKLYMVVFPVVLTEGLKVKNLMSWDFLHNSFLWDLALFCRNVLTRHFPL